MERVVKSTPGPIWLAATSGCPNMDGWIAAGKGDTEIAYFRNPKDAQLFRAAIALADDFAIKEQ